MDNDITLEDIDENGRMSISENFDLQRNDSVSDTAAIHDNSLNTDDVVRHLVENTISGDAATVHDDSVNTDEVVRHLVENTISGEVTEANSTIHDNSLDTDDVAGNLAENMNIDSRDQVLESMLESIMDDEPQDSNVVDDSQTLENENVTLDSSNADVSPSKPNDDSSAPKTDRICQLPFGRIKTIIKSDPDMSVVSAEITFLITKSCELFLQWLGKEVYSQTVKQKKKTIQKRDLDLAINDHLALEFLDGALE